MEGMVCKRCGAENPPGAVKCKKCHGSITLVRAVPGQRRKREEEELVERSVREFMETSGMTRGDLESKLAPVFGEEEASRIAVTEVTRAASARTNEQQRQMRDEMDLEMRRVWHTLRDGLVCEEVCAVLHGMPEEDWRDRFPKGPPAHEGCRCSSSLTMDDAETIRAEALAKATAREKLLRKQAAEKRRKGEGP